MSELEVVPSEEPKKPRPPTTKKLLDQMTSGATENRKQVPVWLNETEKELLRRAARRSGASSLGQFIRQQALVAAKQILDQ